MIDTEALFEALKDPNSDLCTRYDLVRKTFFIRDLYSRRGKCKEYADYSKRFPICSTGYVFPSGARRLKKYGQLNGQLGLDIDSVEDTALCLAVGKELGCKIGMLSKSGHGCFFIFEYDNGFYGAWCALRDAFAEHGFKVDRASDSPSLVRFLCYCPEVVIQDGIVIDGGGVFDKPPRVRVKKSVEKITDDFDVVHTPFQQYPIDSSDMHDLMQRRFDTLKKYALSNMQEETRRYKGSVDSVIYRFTLLCMSRGIHSSIILANFKGDYGDKQVQAAIDDVLSGKKHVTHKDTSYLWRDCITETVRESLIAFSRQCNLNKDKSKYVGTFHDLWVFVRDYCESHGELPCKIDVLRGYMGVNCWTHVTKKRVYITKHFVVFYRNKYCPSIVDDFPVDDISNVKFDEDGFVIENNDVEKDIEEFNKQLKSPVMLSKKNGFIRDKNEKWSRLYFPVRDPLMCRIKALQSETYRLYLRIKRAVSIIDIEKLIDERYKVYREIDRLKEQLKEQGVLKKRLTVKLSCHTRVRRKQLDMIKKALMKKRMNKEDRALFIKIGLAKYPTRQPI
jgi:hypothetical protein